MTFSESTVEFCFRSADGKCQCVKQHAQHLGRRCCKPLLWRGKGKIGFGSWEARHKDDNPNNNRATNCEVLCWDCDTLAIQGS